ncbi:hypothetical protein Acr_00g0070770 [Actinidia rufa]|nr:hypothetical protein Acr_00g0070770 [Actinidia rufa]
MTNASVMLDDAVTASVARGIISPQDEKLLADRTDVEAINDSMALSIQCASSVSNMARRLQVRGNEVQELRTQVLSLQRRNRGLQQENKELKKLVDLYANDMRKKYSELEMNTNRLQEQ